MRRQGWIYVIVVLLSALALSISAFIHRPSGSPPLSVFLILTVLTFLMRVYQIVAPDHRSYEGSTIAYFAGILLLPSWMFVIQVVVSQGVEWVWVRTHTPGSSLRAWYLQPFNMAKCILGGMLAVSTQELVLRSTQNSLHIPGLITIPLMIVVYVGANQLLLGLALWLARGISFKAAGIFRDAILLELPLACMGYAAFVLFQHSPIEVLYVMGPIVLIYQVFTLPKVQDEAMRALKRINQDLTDANHSIQRLNEDLFQALAKVFDMRDPYVGGHAAQVAVYAVAIASEMGLPTERIETIRQSAFLHDIGKLAIPEAILHKPRRLTEAEYDFVKKHCDIGADLLASTEGLQRLAEFIRCHHERWDGQGYPTGIAGEAIPLESRILNLCDSVESMASDRPYHRAMSTADIMEEVRRCAGSQFDPAVAEAFYAVIQRSGPDFVVNSARSVTQQYMAGILADQALFQTMLSEIYLPHPTGEVEAAG
jgi:putative nucleotidyltransferase with HDIG domain